MQPYKEDTKGRRPRKNTMAGAGLSILLEGYSNGDFDQESTPQVISRATMTKPSSPPPVTNSSFSKRDSPSTTAISSSFLERCFLCQQKLLPGKDIYMYKGDRAFCCEECRCRQIFMDEEETVMPSRHNCALAAMKPQPTSSSPSSGSSRSQRRGRDRANGYAF